jgi:hypothetical protein
MSDPTPETTAPEPEPTPDPKPTETVEFWKQKAREQEKRAKENAEAAKRLAEFEAANKSEIEKANDAKAAAEKAAAEAKAEALRWKVAAKFGISDEDADLFLTGTDEETLTKQAERLAGRAEERRKNGNVVPKEGSTSTPTDDPMRDFTRKLFAGAE